MSKEEKDKIFGQIIEVLEVAANNQDIQTRKKITSQDLLVETAQNQVIKALTSYGKIDKFDMVKSSMLQEDLSKVSHQLDKDLKTYSTLDKNKRHNLETIKSIIDNGNEAIENLSNDKQTLAQARLDLMNEGADSFKKQQKPSAKGVVNKGKKQLQKALSNAKGQKKTMETKPNQPLEQHKTEEPDVVDEYMSNVNRLEKKAKELEEAEKPKPNQPLEPQNSAAQENAQDYVDRLEVPYQPNTPKYELLENLQKQQDNLKNNILKGKMQKVIDEVEKVKGGDFTPEEKEKISATALAQSSKKVEDVVFKSDEFKKQPKEYWKAVDQINKSVEKISLDKVSVEVNNFKNQMLNSSPELKESDQFKKAFDTVKPSKMNKFNPEQKREAFKDFTTKIGSMRFENKDQNLDSKLEQVQAEVSKLQNKSPENIVGSMKELNDDYPKSEVQQAQQEQKPQKSFARRTLDALVSIAKDAFGQGEKPSPVDQTKDKDPLQALQALKKDIKNLGKGEIKQQFDKQMKPIMDDIDKEMMSKLDSSSKQHQAQATKSERKQLDKLQKVVKGAKFKEVKNRLKDKVLESKPVAAISNKLKSKPKGRGVG
ncbi:MAG: hypothetical protein DGJ47_000773 [Rickettsiaceae bacterium]